MTSILTGLALGAAGAFLFDPQQGRRRRALVRDKLARGIREGREFGDAAAKDLRARGEGLSTRIRAQARALRGGPVGDDVLVARVRAKLGRYVSHPHAIRVTAQNGFVTLDGNVLAAEHGRLLRAVHAIAGVRDMADRLDVHASAEGVSALQGGITPPGERWELLQASWSPGTRALVGGTGGLLALYALARGGVLGVAALASGAALIARARINRPLSAAMNSKRGVVDRQAEGNAAVGR
jgi:hypothetical protein